MFSLGLLQDLLLVRCAHNVFGGTFLEVGLLKCHREGQLLNLLAPVSYGHFWKLLMTLCFDVLLLNEDCSLSSLSNLQLLCHPVEMLVL